MDYAHQLNAEHEARKRKFWNPPRRAINPTPTAVTVTAPPPVTPAAVFPPIPTIEESRAARLRRLEDEIRDLAARIRDELNEVVIDEHTRPLGPPVRLIIRTVAAYYNVTVTDVLSHRRTADIMRPRQVAMFVAKQLTRHGLPTIGRHFGGRDHTTILSGVRKMARLREMDPDLSAQIEELIGLLSPAVEGQP